MEGMIVRPGTMDEYVVKEQRQYAGLVVPGDRVIDLGGNIGAFSRWAMDQGAHFVASYEPEPANFRLLLKNVEDRLRACAFQVAVVGRDHPPTVRLYVNSGTNKGAHSLHVQRGRAYVDVKAVSFPSVFIGANATKVKCDIEGGEYDLEWEEVPDTVTGVAMELHLNKKQWRQHDAPLLIEKMRALGWTAVRQPRVTANNWYTLGIWRR